MSTPCNMQPFIIWMMDGARDRREGDGTQGDEVLEGAKDNRDDFGILFVAQHVKTGRKRRSAC
jgi:hypothetical protein